MTPTRRRPSELDFKSPEEAPAKEHVLLHELHVAKELGMTLTQLRREMTYEELWLWVAYFGLFKTSTKKQAKKQGEAVDRIDYRRLFLWPQLLLIFRYTSKAWRICRSWSAAWRRLKRMLKS